MLLCCCPLAGVAKSSAAMAAQWFNQDLFQGLGEEEDEEEGGRGPAKKRKGGRPAAGVGAAGGWPGCLRAAAAPGWSAATLECCALACGRA